mmetsp:Transcript_5156/g.15094  ORF Transcript_5156/g.15094 Transcript_5156/m.15094 type:complete len:439 (+) Transcript_5156:64-1380(+)
MGALALLLHGALATVATPTLYNHFSALWFAALLLLAGVDLLLTVLSLPRQSSSRAAYACACAALAIAAGLCYAVDERVDICILAFLQAATFAVAAWRAIGRSFGHAGASGDAELGSGKEMPQPADRAGSRPRYAACLHVAGRAVFAFLALILTYGAAVTAFSRTAFAPRGTHVRVSVAGGASLSLHYYCEDLPQGVAAARVSGEAVPRIWLTSSPAHGVVDFLGVQRFLALKGFRTCSFDPPGFDQSSRERASASELADFLPGLVRAVDGAGARVVFVAWGGGASGAVDIAKARLVDVAAVVLVYAFPPDFEWTSYQLETGVSDAETRTYRDAQLAARVGFAQVILGLAVPWGLMPVFAPLHPPSPRLLPARSVAGAARGLLAAKTLGQPVLGAPPHGGDVRRRGCPRHQCAPARRRARGGAHVQAHGQPTLPARGGR